MEWLQSTLSITTHQQGLHDITDMLNTQIRDWRARQGILYIFLQHTSASLVINENYDHSAQRDMEELFNQLIPEGEKWYDHTLEGLDDSPAHLRTMITHTSLTVPVDNGKMNLGTWQGIFLAEHRRRGHQRRILLRMLSINDETKK